jgi:hypothetical protein
MATVQGICNLGRLLKEHEMRLFRFFTKSARTGAPRSFIRRVPLRVEQLETRLVPYSVSGNAWPHPELVTISFEPDGTIVGSNTSGYIYSNLFATFNATFGSATTWQNQILQAAQVWAQQTNLNFAVVADSGADIGSGNYQQGDPNMGDIRIGGYAFGTTTLAQAYMPPPVNNYSIAGDVQFNTGQTFTIGSPNSPYDLFTVAVHEIGHALGLYHSTVITANMYANYRGPKTGLSSDDTAGIRNIYSNNNPRSTDSYGGANNSFATAADLTSLLNPTALTATVTGLDITTAGQAEYFSVVAPVTTNSTFTVNVQSSGLSLLAPTLTVYAADQVTVLGSANGAGQYGTTLSVTVNGVSAGQQFYVKVAGADSSAFGTGRYGMTLNFGTGVSPSVPLPDTTTSNGSPLNGGGGQATKVNAETLDNTYTANAVVTDGSQAVAMDAAGDYVVTWSSYGEFGSGWAVCARRYNALGVAQGGEFRVNTYTIGDKKTPAVAMDAAGDFVITWASYGQSGAGWGVYAQRYNALGVAQGGEFQVNTYAIGDKDDPSIAMDGVGNFVITWASYGQSGTGWGIYAQRYNALGLPQGGEFQVNTYTSGDKRYPRAAMNAAGNFVITWSSYGQSRTGWGIYAQRYNALGAPQGSEFQVNTYAGGDTMYSTAAMDTAGGFVIAWRSYGQGSSFWSIHAQRYNALGLAQGSEFPVSTYAAGDQVQARIAMDGTGNFLITWASYGEFSSGWNISARQYNATGGALGTDFQVNSTLGNQQHPAVAMNNNGAVILVWSGSDASNPNGVFAQPFNVKGGSGMSPMVPGPSAPELDNDYAADPSVAGNNGIGTRTNAGSLDLLVPLANGTLVHPNGCRCPQCLAAARAAQLQENARVIQPPALVDELAGNQQFAEQSHNANWSSLMAFGLQRALDVGSDPTGPNGPANGLAPSGPNGHVARGDITDEILAAGDDVWASSGTLQDDVAAVNEDQIGWAAWRQVCDTCFANFDDLWQAEDMLST